MPGGGVLFALFFLSPGQSFQTDVPHHGLTAHQEPRVPTEAGGKGWGRTEGHVPHKPSLGRPCERLETEAQK